jgi:hypothetical protein
MTDTSRHDAWQGGSSYEAYMGRWSRRVAAEFVDWPGVPPRRDWLEIGCGTGALSSAILERGAPRGLLALDMSGASCCTRQGPNPIRGPSSGSATDRRWSLRTRAATRSCPASC